MFMNIQIFGKSKCFDTKKAQRYFKERRIPFQFIDIMQKGLSKGELAAVTKAVGMDDLIRRDVDAYYLFSVLTEAAKPDKLTECPELYQTPIVRNGRQATVGFRPEVWKEWE
jgi:arsenate reductase